MTMRRAVFSGLPAALAAADDWDSDHYGGGFRHGGFAHDDEPAGQPVRLTSQEFRECEEARREVERLRREVERQIRRRDRENAAMVRRVNGW